MGAEGEADASVRGGRARAWNEVGAERGWCTASVRSSFALNVPEVTETKDEGARRGRMALSSFWPGFHTHSNHPLPISCSSCESLSLRPPNPLASELLSFLRPPSLCGLRRSLAR